MKNINTDTIQGSLTELKGKAMKQWSKLTDNDFTEFKGNVQELKGKIQKIYGYTKEQIEDEFAKFVGKPVEKANDKIDDLTSKKDNLN